ncbi:MAG: hypothetical protein ABSD68_02185 [Candidatus Micrarchaeales archaeon]|jgi:hypothetical protein
MTGENQGLLYEDIKLSLFSNLCNATGVYRRTVTANKKLFQKNAKHIIKGLITKVDANTIKNADIRSAIKKLAKESGFNDKVGASQKVINVYLKYYCAIANKNRNIMKELDCPIDSLIRSDNKKVPNVNLKNMSYTDYVKSQNVLEGKYGMRVIADIPSYDKRKLY